MKFTITKFAGVFMLALTLMIAGCSEDSTGPGESELSINNVSPASARVGEEVTINGAGFSSNATVTFTDGVDAEVTSATASQLKVTVPEGAETGPITVSLNGMNATSSSDFTVSEEPAPEVPEPYASFPGTKIAEDEVWKSDTTIAGPHFVLPGVKLTIEEGVTVSFKYHNNNSDEVGTIITLPADNENFSEPRESAQLIAQGSKDAPIVFTGVRKEINSWGGIILGGAAPINVPGGKGDMEGLEDAVQYGGDNDADNSGILQYVRIEYTGYSISEGSELQGLTLYAVGSGTTIDHVNIYGTSDDGFEIFGGTVNLKYMVIFGADDDSFDIDQGWQGKGQFWLGVQRSGADQGFENDGCANLDDCDGGNGPSHPTISNVTVFGANDSPNKDNMGMKLRENYEGDYSNIIISNFDGYNFLLDGRNDGDDDDADITFENYGTSLTLSNFVLQNNGGWEVSTEADRYADSYVMAESDNPADLFNNPDGYDFSLPGDSPYMTGGSVPDDPFFDDVSYRGAFGDTDWTRDGSWVLWPLSGKSL